MALLVRGRPVHGPTEFVPGLFMGEGEEPCTMERESLRYLPLIAAVIVGLIAMVLVEYLALDRRLLLVGGGVALAGFAGIVVIIARMPEPAGQHGGH